MVSFSFSFCICWTQWSTFCSKLFQFLPFFFNLFWFFQYLKLFLLFLQLFSYSLNAVNRPQVRKNKLPVRKNKTTNNYLIRPVNLTEDQNGITPLQLHRLPSVQIWVKSVHFFISFWPEKNFKHLKLYLKVRGT